ncbi:MAG: GNAT family N-acetyltransferase [Pseudomonadota bacterium]
MVTTGFRWAGASDYNALGRVMHSAVRTGSSPYTEAQRAAWVASPRSGAAWEERLAAQDILAAESGGEIVAFMSLDADGYVDFVFILPAFRGRGLFRALFERIEARATERGQPRIWVHASLMAAPAFEAMGFERLNCETVEISGERLERFEMEKQLRNAS